MVCVVVAGVVVCGTGVVVLLANEMVVATKKYKLRFEGDCMHC